MCSTECSSWMQVNRLILEKDCGVGAKRFIDNTVFFFNKNYITQTWVSGFLTIRLKWPSNILKWFLIFPAKISLSEWFLIWKSEAQLRMTRLKITCISRFWLDCTQLKQGSLTWTTQTLFMRFCVEKKQQNLTIKKDAAKN